MNKGEYANVLRKHIEALDVGDALKKSHIADFAYQVAAVVPPNHDGYGEDEIGFGLTVALTSVALKSGIGDVIDAARVAGYEQADFETLSYVKELAAKVTPPLTEFHEMIDVVNILHDTYELKAVTFRFLNVMNFKLHYGKNDHCQAVISFVRVDPDIHYKTWTVTAWCGDQEPRTAYAVGKFELAMRIAELWGCEV